MGIYRSEIADLRRSLDDNIGKRVIIREAPGKRSKPLERIATIENTYQKYFRVKFEDADRIGSYNYTDLFTKSIEVKSFDGEPFAPVLQNHIEVKKRSLNNEILKENS
ncbi:MAG: Veg family protein [Clostridia bacterium]|nr:Veg family protein [Clostridia bacterium]